MTELFPKIDVFGMKEIDGFLGSTSQFGVGYEEFELGCHSPKDHHRSLLIKGLESRIYRAKRDGAKVIVWRGPARVKEDGDDVEIYARFHFLNENSYAGDLYVNEYHPDNRKDEFSTESTQPANHVSVSIVPVR